MQKHFYCNQKFNSYEDLCQKAEEFCMFHNNNHRYSSQKNLTPNNMSEKILHKSKLNKDFDFDKKIYVEEGKMIFIRFVRSDLKLNILNTIFTLKSELKYSYVVAEIVLGKNILVVSRNKIIYHIFEFIMTF
jgi:hypothetical protein